MHFPFTSRKKQSRNSHQATEISPTHQFPTDEKNPKGRETGTRHESPNRQSAPLCSRLARATPKCVRMASSKLGESVRFARSQVSARFMHKDPSPTRIARARSFGKKKKKIQERRAFLASSGATDLPQQGMSGADETSTTPSYSDVIKGYSQARRDFEDAFWLVDKEIYQLERSQSKFEKMLEKEHSNVKSLAAKNPDNTQGSMSRKRELQVASDTIEDLDRRLEKAKNDLVERRAAIQRLVRHHCNVIRIANDPDRTLPTFADSNSPPQQAPNGQDASTTHAVLDRNGDTGLSHKVSDAGGVRRRPRSDYDAHHHRRPSQKNQREPEQIPKYEGKGKAPAIRPASSVYSRDPGDGSESGRKNHTKTQEISSRRDFAPELMPEHLSLDRVYLGRKYRHAINRLGWARWEFDKREETRDREHFTNLRRLEKKRGPKGLPQEEFDLAWCKHISMLTRKIIEAEERLKKARDAALRAGCDLIDSEATSMFDDGRSVGYPLSWEDIWQAELPKEKIQEWVQTLDSVPPQVEIEHIPSEPSSKGEEIAPWDSWSGAAEPRYRARIQRWAKACMRRGKLPV